MSYTSTRGSNGLNIQEKTKCYTCKREANMKQNDWNNRTLESFNKRRQVFESITHHVNLK